jgi:Asparagine synthase
VPRLDSCLFAVWLADAGDLLLLGERVRRLAAFYGRDARVEAVCDGHVMVGGIGHDHGPLAWGGPIPEGEEPLDGLAAIFDVDADSVRVSCASGGVTSLYEAASARIRAWSTHAVAAAWLARGEARVDPGRIPELLTWGFVGGRRTLIDGALAVPAATQIDLRAAREPEVSCFLPPGRRWAQLPEEVAYEHAERALLESLERRLRGARDVYLGLTGGLDSCVVAVALKELGIEVTAFTWGQAPVGDVGRGYARRRRARHSAPARAGAHPRGPRGARRDPARRALDGRLRPGALHRAHLPGGARRGRVRCRR